jgi:hypothetical protein
VVFNKRQFIKSQNNNIFEGFLS